MVAGGQLTLVEGREGHLFLNAFGDLEPLAIAQEQSDWKIHAFPRIRASLGSKAKRVIDRGIPYVCLIAPEASSVYPERLPDGISIALPTIGEIVAAACQADGWPVICPTEALRSAAGPVDTYFKLDTHWNHYGAYIAYREVLARLPRSLGLDPVRFSDARFGSRVGYGDLGVHASPERKGPLQTVEVKKHAVTSTTAAYEQREKSYRVSKNPGGRGRALIFRDSFTSMMTSFFEQTFAEVHFVAPAPSMPDDAIDTLRPDVVIFEVAERGLLLPPAHFADWSERTFQETYLDSGADRPGGSLMIEAGRSAGAGRFADAVRQAALSVILDGDESGLPRLAEFLFADQQYQTCIEVCDRAVAGGTAGKTIHYWRAQSFFITGRPDEGLHSIRNALAFQPDNALFNYALGEWLLHAGDHASAICALEKCVDRDPLYQRAYEALEAALVKAGQDEKARDVAARREDLFRA